MFNLYNLFTNNTAKDIIDSMPTFAWKIGPTFYIDEKEYTIGELVEYIKNLIKENNDLEAQLNSIEKDGTEEHNNAVKLRQEIAELKVEIEKYSKGNKNWMALYQEVVDKNNELLKEIKHLSYLKEKNVELIDRVNEIDSDQNEEYRAEIFTLKNECALLRAKNNTLQEFIDTKIKVDWKSARIDILERDLQKCAEQRDEFKHQLNAANKENEKLKKDIVDYVFEKDNQVNFFEEEFNRLKSITKEEYDQIPVIGDTDRINNLLQKAKDLTEGIEVDLDKPLDEQCDKETSWEEAASDLALRVAKLEEQLKYTQKIICPE